jgi:hypothetical protein
MEAELVGLSANAFVERKIAVAEIAKVLATRLNFMRVRVAGLGKVALTADCHLLANGCYCFKKIF